MLNWIKSLDEKRSAALAAAVIAAAGLAAYANSFTGSFFYDDRQSIAENPTLRHAWRLGEILAPNLGGGVTVNGRPVLNLSLALNYAIGGTNPWSYHALNLAIHIIAGLALFGIVRRTLVFGRGRPWSAGRRPVAFAFAVALIWTLHPLQTEAITYIIQRAESLMGMFYLLTVYCFVRAVQNADGAARLRSPDGELRRGSEASGRKSSVWFLGSVAACLFGMGTKEVMVTAPVLVFLYDRTFIAGSFREAWRLRWRYYAALAATWILLAALVASTGGNRGGTVGFGVGVKWWAYGLTQFEAIIRYLRLAIWPNPLVFEYGTFWVKSASEVALPALVVTLLAAGTLVALWRRPVLGFLGVWFFGILAPSSLMPGTIQMIVEHRMYLSLAAVWVLLLAGIDWMARYLGRGETSFLATVAAIALVFGGLTYYRNGLYGSEIALWSDTVAKRPDNAVAQYNLGDVLDQADRLPEAMVHFTRAWQLRPDLPETHYSLGLALFQQGKPEEAVAEYETALRIKPAYVEAENNLGVALAALGRTSEAISHYQAALKLNPGDSHLHDSLGNALMQTGRGDEATTEYAEAVRLDPASAVAQTNLGGVLLRGGHFAEAAAHLEEAVRLEPDLAEAQSKLGDALMETNRAVDAVPHYEKALQLNPRDVQAHNNLAIALASTGRLVEAVGHYQAALQLDPTLVDAHFNLANALFRLGHPAEAADQYESVLKLRPDDPQARTRLGLARKAQAQGQGAP